MAETRGPIRKIGYDRRRTKLSIRFASGEEYIFVGVPESVHQALKSSPDLARYVGERILDAYPYNKVAGA